MTRKSTGRIERDIKLQKAQEALENNTCWDDLNVISGDANLLMQKHNIITGMMRNKELCAFLPNVQSVIDNGKLLAKDVAALATDLLSLQALHAGKVGGSDDPDVIMHTIGLYEQYSLFLERHEAVVMPTIGAMLEQFHVAEERLNVALQAGHDQLVEMAADVDAGISEGEFTEVLPAGTIADQGLYDKAIADGTLAELPVVVPGAATPAFARGETPAVQTMDEAGFMAKH